MRLKIPDVFGLRGIAIASGVSLVVGTVAGGWALNEFWLGKTAKANLEASQAALSATQKELSKSNLLLKNAAERANTEAQARLEAEERLSRAYDDNARLAQSRASTTTRIIEKGEAVGQSLKNDSPWIYYAWPRELRSFTFRRDAGSELPSPLASGYPASE